MYLDLDLRPLEDYAHRLGKVAETQFPFAAARALTDAGKLAVKEDLPRAMQKAFHEPVRFTLNAFFSTRADKRDLKLEIKPREFANKGSAAFQYLEPQVKGGARKQKRSEQRLSAVTGKKLYVLPAKGEKLNKHGNVTPSEMVKILSRVGALADQSIGKRGRRKIAKAKRFVNHGARSHRSDYFIGGAKGSGAPKAIYRLLKKGVVEPVLALTQTAPKYKRRFDYDPALARSIDKHLPRFFDQRLAEAIASARL